jgi:flagellar M-ring protein FliF
VYPQQVTPPQTAKSENATYAASHKVRHTTQGPGHIRRLTAAIVVNDRVAANPAGQKGLQTAAWQPRTVDELHTLTSLAQAAVGFDAGRGDLVTVQDLAFDENRKATSPSLAGQALTVVEGSPVLVKYATILVGLLLLILLVIRPAVRQARSTARVAAKGQSKELAAGAQASLPELEPVPPDLERLRTQQVFDQVTEQLKRDPAQSSRLLQSWIHSD